MVVTFQHKIILRPGSIFCFGTISSVEDEEGTLHRLADPPERKPSSEVSRKIGARQEKVQPPTLLKRTIKLIFLHLHPQRRTERRSP
jgi:hypothetical protein